MNKKGGLFAYIFWLGVGFVMGFTVAIMYSG